MAGGPIVLMGIDAEDGGPGGHGPISNYIDVVNSILANVTNGGSGILVIGGGKNPTDNVTAFWDAIGANTGVTVSYVNGANIATQSFSGFSMIAVVSSVGETASGGLTQAENDLLATRQSDIANFVNNGGGLIGFSQTGFINPYAYLAIVGTFTVNINLSYDNITPTAAGMSIGISDDLDICCWHDEYVTFPSFLSVLATNPITGNASAIGGQSVVIPTGCPVANPQTCCQHVIEFKTQLVPPALGNSVSTRVFFAEDPIVEDVCPEKVIICGKLVKEITYTQVDRNGVQSENTLTDERSFQCVIDREDANEGDEFEVVGAAVLCQGAPVLMNRGTRPSIAGTGEVDVYWRLREKDIVKVCIRKRVLEGSN
ncbi:hypothetical protein [Ornithinibacillus californiensis]|uniref:hypothetical protein n=1 Tax=Ornithinibacillus californiensis TaxID=161536 RepID=UPI00069FBD84|nr:hypothetical protein [Ornithinibacillus californiensis]